MSTNRAVVYLRPGQVEVQSIPFPKLLDPLGRSAEHGVILRVLSTNICGSDQHMVRGRTTAPAGLVLGHEITGEVLEAGRDVETLKPGDMVSVPFNVACGRCRSCKEQNTGVCLSVNPARAGGAYGYVDMGGWIGGQAEYVMVPYADFNLLKFPDRAQAMEKIRDLTCLSDILPTGYHGAVTAGVGPGSTVYVAGAGPVGLAAAASARLLGAAVVIVGDVNPARLEHARKVGFETTDLSRDATLAEQIGQILGTPEVDSAIDAVGFEARGHGHAGAQVEAPATVLNALMEITRAAGRIGIPGLYVTQDPGAADKAAQHGALSIRFGLGWAKSHSFFTGQTPVMKYNRALMQAILWERIRIADVVGVQVIPLDEAPTGYAEFDAGAPKKFVIDPHGLLAQAA
ncbi:formaldehyde dehydrogenase, glutathione-independent [Verminephrobacter aporrectodeae subsp. tuberculatae]|uniref:Formaldehyde dehydrogenase, glutathione-independent n=1 Tax=Verminephrobacter aporrectodeae subsp. tuberculatae TaxID=1110392 RepID=A0ABT3KSK7_9BURK|nr:formaldehyde dehydrogenase, glutathione-independent [Verminephrobacter aporrectodeae]MCW5257520.1 formaldehyde dehydrogenase, glutathione-independent [Verminephrobacter aporrectodeae subsp. tuberculatae]MCW5321297.1 formaldehyde dehydrogenase, glutathione-independent [Verminephrobacter aporrectodeae subsp. tuberculatae]MCW8165459.1 formaldehyde dehydrogenase, glutathione-independent [Verminephrobacter aporrectodeae subsp. tuberculatae]MCW8170027.1 formaldehyde dehydrogenase, glutathione-inde